MNNQGVNIGLRLKTLRTGRKMTQEELASRLGVTRCTISNYECGRRAPHLSELKRFAEFFGVGLDYFGAVSSGEVLELLSRARDVFHSDVVPADKKDEIYREIMKLYLDIKK